MFIRILLLLLIPTLCYADNVRVQVLTGGDAIYLPMDKYCTPEQVTQILAIVNTSPKAIENEKERRIVEQRIAQEEASKIPVKEITAEELQAEVVSIDQQIADLTAQKEEKQMTLQAKPMEEKIEEIIK